MNCQVSWVSIRILALLEWEANAGASRTSRRRFVRERRSVREFSDKEKKKPKKTLDSAGVVRDGR